MMREVVLALALLSGSSVSASGAPGAVGTLGAYNVDLNQTSVSGLSSGAFFAIQMSVAFSSTIVGGGIFAGGPYHCAQGSETTALTTCMSAIPAPSAKTYETATATAFSKGGIDDPKHIATQRYFLFSGTKDTTVNPKVMDALNIYLGDYGSDVVYKNNLVAAHTQPTDDKVNKNSCTLSSSPYLSDCDYDGSGIALAQIYGKTLNPRNDGTLQPLIQFSQTEFITGQSMDTAGYVYVPASCAAGEACTLHISFHGCEQGSSSVGTQYVVGAGFNKWADTNNMIVLYPQAKASSSKPSNPNGCWDWWGYNNAANYDQRTGSQMAAVMDMAKRVASAVAPSLPAPTGLAVDSVTNSSCRAHWNAVDEADGYNVYANGIKLTTASPAYNTSFTAYGLQSGTTYKVSVAGVQADGKGGFSQGALSATVDCATTGPPPPLAAPTGLKVTSVGGDTVSLAWDAAAPGVSSFVVVRDGAQVGTPTVSSFSDTGLKESTTYAYSVIAANGDARSAPSETVGATTTDGWQCAAWYDNNYNHVVKGRATTTGGYVYTVGAGDLLGLYNVATYTTVAETSDGYYEKASC